MQETQWKLEYICGNHLSYSVYLLPALYFYIRVILLKAFEKYFTMFVESERFLSFQSHVSVYSIVLILQDL